MMDNIITNNQFMDKLIIYLKELVLNSTLKDSELANSKETIQSIRDSDLYISCIEDVVTFDSFDTIPLIVLEQSFVPASIIKEGLKNKYDIPKEYRQSIITNMKKYIISNYIEKNDYYRSLNGLPDLEDVEFIYVQDEHVEPTIPIHLLSSESIEILTSKGILDMLIDQNPDKKYLRHLGKRKIEPYHARRSPNFGLLYVPDIDDINILNRFKELLEKNRIYTIKTIYSEAFKYNSDYYDNFISIFIKIQTVIDMITEVPDIVVRKDFFDDISIRDMFISHSVEHFPEIPRRYQLAMVKNLNNLLKFKSTTKNLVDICSIFGFDNVSIFKYYLLKDRKVDINNNYIDPQYAFNPETGENEVIEGSIYDLKFVKVPIDGLADDYIRDRVNHIGYDDVVYGDIHWNGDTPHHELKNTILKQHFNYVYSKYISIDTLYDMSLMSFEMTYFFNLLFSNRDLEERLTLSIRNISYEKQFKLTDIICFLYMIMYEKLGIEDTIIDTTSKVLNITAFNFDADLAELGRYVKSKGYTLQDFGLDKFKIPTSDILTYKDLVNIYITNKNVHDHLAKEMYHAENIRIYKIYKKIYDALMISRLNTSMFKKANGEFAETYTEYIKFRDPVLYSYMENIRALDEHDKNYKIINTIDEVLLALEEYLNIGDFNFSFSSMSNISSELIKQYLYKVINFFKSYTVEMLSINTIYTIDDKYLNKIPVIDDIFIYSDYRPGSSSADHHTPNDKIFIRNKELLKKTKYNIEDNVFIFRTNK